MCSNVFGTQHVPVVSSDGEERGDLDFFSTIFCVREGFSHIWEAEISACWSRGDAAVSVLQRLVGQMV